MSYDFWIPTIADELAQATLTEDGELILHDYDLEPDLALEALGDEPSLVLKTLEQWKADPIGLLCGEEELLPIRHNGLAAWAWASVSVDHFPVGHSYDEFPVEIRTNLDKILEVAFSALTTLTKSKPMHKNLVMAKRYTANLAAPRNGYFLKKADIQKVKAIRAVDSVLGGIIGVFFEKRPQNVKAFCETAKYALSAIDDQKEPLSIYYNQLVAAAIEVLGTVQEEHGGLK